MAPIKSSSCVNLVRWFAEFQSNDQGRWESFVIDGLREDMVIHTSGGNHYRASSIEQSSTLMTLTDAAR